ncbi:MAG: AIR synthase related protein, partial [Candidatus Latescibacterota bacterium]
MSGPPDRPGTVQPSGADPGAGPTAPGRIPYRPGKLPHAELARLIGRYTHAADPRLVVPPGLGEDAAVIDLGGPWLVAKTDPITFATDAIGWYAVHVNANDVAAMGARPAFFLATLLLPAGQATPELAESIFRSIHEAATELGVAVCGGHTEITRGVEQPIVVGQMLGLVSRDALVRSSGLEPGHALILTKGMAIEATALIARQRRDELVRRGFALALLDRCAAFLTDPGISVVRDARAAAGAARLSAMHDPTEGGLATGLAELAAASGVGLEVHHETLPIAPESVAMCAAFGLDPLGVISSG